MPVRNGEMTFPNVLVIATPPAAHATTAPDAGAESGLRAFRDPSTGKLREPTHEEVQALEVQDRFKPRRLSRGFQMTQLPNGAVGAMVGESFMSFSVVRRVDGRELAEACIMGEAQALAWLRSDSFAVAPLNSARTGQREAQ